MVFEWMILGSIPRYAPDGFRASQATHPPRQGLLSINISNSVFRFPIMAPGPPICHLSFVISLAIGYRLLAIREALTIGNRVSAPCAPFPKHENRYFVENC
jgi:hypothetical protein